jgi:hypothetical protein
MVNTGFFIYGNFDEETGQLMQSVTVPGGDVIQIPYKKEE